MGSKLLVVTGHKDDQNTDSVTSESKPNMPMRGLVLTFPGAASDAWSKLETQGRTACDRLHFGSWENRQNVFDCRCKIMYKQGNGKRDFCMPVKLKQVCIWHLVDWSDSLQISQPPGSSGEALVSQ